MEPIRFVLTAWRTREGASAKSGPVPPNTIILRMEINGVPSVKAWTQTPPAPPTLRTVDTAEDPFNWDFYRHCEPVNAFDPAIYGQQLLCEALGEWMGNIILFATAIINPKEI